MLIPDIVFNEQNTGTNPVRFNIRNRIGIVGEFTKGPALTFSFINGFSDFARTYGSDLKSGSQAFQAAWDQGAEDFGLVRVLGSPKVACGEVLFSGVSSKPNNLLMYLKYVGEVTPIFGTVLKTAITTTGSYTGVDDGRYYFYVDSIVGSTATIKWKFLDIADAPGPFLDPQIDWAPVTDDITVHIVNDKGVAKLVDDGVSLIFGTLTQVEDIALIVGQEFSVRVNYFLNQIPIFQDATPSQVTTSLMSMVTGLSPIGDVIRRDDDMGAKFCVEEEYIGAVGNGFSYYFELQSPDGVYTGNATYNYATSNNTITLATPAQAVHIRAGASISTSTSGVLQANTTVQSVNTTTGVVTLSQNLVGTAGSGTASFVFTNTSGLNITPNGFSNTTFMSGGEDGPRLAFREFYSMNGTPILRVFGSSVGAWANSLRLTLYPLTASSFRLSVEDLNGDNYNPEQVPENYVIDLAEDGAIDENGFLIATRDSALIRVAFIPKYFNPTSFNSALLYSSPQRIAPPDATVTDITNPAHPDHYGPNYLQEISLEGGFDGPDITEQDWIKAIDVMAEFPAHIILAAGQYRSRAVKVRLMTQAENSHELEGLRIAVLNTRPSLPTVMARQETIGFDSKRAVMVTGWSTYANFAGSTRFALAPDALYAGKLAVIPFEAGPNARTTAGPVQGIFEVDTRFNSKASLQIYTDARLEILALDQTQAGFYFINGRTLSSGTAFEKVSIRRVYDLIRQDLFVNLQQYKSETNTRLLREQIAASINAYMSSLTRAGTIANYLPTIIDSSNNTTEDFIAGRLNVQIQFLPLYAADYIYINIVRNSDAGIQIGD